MQVEEVIIEEVDLIEKIKMSEAKNNEVIKAVEEMKQCYTGIENSFKRQYKRIYGTIQTKWSTF